jgi:excisionase family DNA binding protein
MNPPTANGQALIDKREVARMLGGVSISFVNQLLAKKALPRVRLGYRTVRIPQDAVDAYIRSRTMNAR